MLPRKRLYFYICACKRSCQDKKCAYQHFGNRRSDVISIWPDSANSEDLHTLTLSSLLSRASCFFSDSFFICCWLCFDLLFRLFPQDSLDAVSCFQGISTGRRQLYLDVVWLSVVFPKAEFTLNTFSLQQQQRQPSIVNHTNVLQAILTVFLDLNIFMKCLNVKISNKKDCISQKQLWKQSSAHILHEQSESKYLI